MFFQNTHIFSGKKMSIAALWRTVCRQIKVEGNQEIIVVKKVEDKQHSHWMVVEVMRNGWVYFESRQSDLLISGLWVRARGCICKNGMLIELKEENCRGQGWGDLEFQLLRVQLDLFS